MICGAVCTRLGKAYTFQQLSVDLATQSFPYIMPRDVVLYASSATGMLTTKKYITSIQNLLQAKGVPYTEVDCAVEVEKRDAMAAISGTKVLPQVFVDGKYIGVRQFCS